MKVIDPYRPLPAAIVDQMSCGPYPGVIGLVVPRFRLLLGSQTYTRGDWVHTARSRGVWAHTLDPDKFGLTPLDPRVFGLTPMDPGVIGLTHLDPGGD